MANKTREVVSPSELFYLHCISALFAIFADGLSLFPALVFKGEMEPMVSTGPVTEMVSKGLKLSWAAC